MNVSGQSSDLPPGAAQPRAARRNQRGERLGARTAAARARWRDPGRAVAGRAAARPARSPARGAATPAGPRAAASPSSSATRGRSRRRVVVVQELGLVRGHVDADRAVAAARLAGQAQVERLADLGRAPAVGDQVAADHLEQQPGAAARRVLLLAGGLVARAHHGAGAVAALADPDAAAGGLGEVAAVVRVARATVEQLAGCTPVPAAGRRRAAAGDDHAGVHPAVRVPDRLEPPEQRRSTSAPYIRASSSSGPGRRRARPSSEPPCATHQVGRLLDEPPEPARRRRAEQIEVEPDVDAALAEVAVGDAAQPVPALQLAELAQVGTEPLGRDGARPPSRARPRRRPASGSRCRHPPRGSARARVARRAR